MSILFSCKKDDTPGSNVKLTEGLQAYYPFNGNANDESGNGNNGTIINGAVIVADKNGKPQSALSVNGTNGVLVANGSKLVFQDEMTISFDVMIRQTGRQVYVAAVNYDTGYGFGYMVSSSNPNDTRSLFSAAKSGISCTNYYTETGGIAFGSTLEKESWYTMVATYKNGTEKLFINGNQAGEAQALSSKINVCANTNFVIGTWWKNDFAGLNGKIDNVRVYNRVLNAVEIQALNN
jgi:hypothetical protein